MNWLKRLLCRKELAPPAGRCTHPYSGVIIDSFGEPYSNEELEAELLFADLKDKRAEPRVDNRR